MPYYTEEQIAKAREMDLLTYLRLHDPGELVHVSGNEYCTREHDSLKISNGKWNWWSRGFGGASALDYLIKVKEIPFLQAMGMILDTEGKSTSVFDVQRQEKRFEKRLLLPERSSNNDQIIRYLTGRGIDWEVSTGRSSKAASGRDFSMNHFHITTAFLLAMTMIRCRDTQVSERPDPRKSWARQQDQIRNMPFGSTVPAARFTYSRALSICFPLPRS